MSYKSSAAEMVAGKYFDTTGGQYEVLDVLPAMRPIRTRSSGPVSKPLLAREKTPRGIPELGQPVSLGEEATVNPFLNETADTISGAYEWLKTILLFPVFLLRAALCLALLISAWCFTSIAMLGVRRTANPEPLPAWRRPMLLLPRLCARTGLFVCGFYWVQVKGRPAPRSVAPVVVSNHVTLFDPIYFFYRLLPVYVSAKDHEVNFITRTFLRAAQVIAVDRNSPDSRKETSESIKARAVDERWPRVMVFPEGTTTNGRTLISFKGGAFAAGLPVQPIVIRYPYRHLDPSWGKVSALKVIFRSMTQFINFMEVHYLPVMEPFSREKALPALFTERVRSEMAHALGVPCTEHTFGDLALAVKADELRTKPSRGPGGAEMGKLRKLLRVNTRDAKAFLEKFAEMDSSHDGLVNLQEFLTALGLPNTSATRQVFNMFDTKETGAIDFREFVAGLVFISRDTSFDSFVATAFKAMDTNRDGRLSRAEAEAALREGFPSIADGQLERLFLRLDLDRDGTVSWEDFRSFLQKNPEHLAALLAARPDILEEARAKASHRAEVQIRT